MDKKLFNKSSNFFKREGFYVLLFVCLCVVATVAAVTSRSGRVIKNEPPNQVAQNRELNEAPIIAEEPNTEMQNALQVKKNADTSNVPKNEVAVAPVSKVVDTTFKKPLEGQLIGKYSEELVNLKNSNSARTNLGIDIKAEKGTAVVASLDGEVEEVTDVTNYGMTVVMNHKNGLKTEYSNLDVKVPVAKGQTIKKGSVIGKVGDTSLRGALEDDSKFFLHFAVKKSDANGHWDYIDPAKYIKY